MKVIHCPTDVAGQAWIISRAQRKLGIKSDVMVFNSNRYYNYEYDFNFHLEKFPSPLKHVVGSFKSSRFLIDALREYDIFHFHSKTILPKNYDMLIAKKLGKKVVFHFHGCEIRLREHGICQICKKISRNQKLNLINNAKKNANLNIVATPDLLEVFPDSIWINDSIDINKWAPERKKMKNDEVIKILHSPSDRLVKGTSHIEFAVKKLKKEGYNIKLLLMENVPNIKVKEFAQQADISIDQLLIGWYGVFGIESMSLGIPTCAYIRMDLEKYAKGCPIVNINTKNIVEKLRTLIEDEQLRRKIGIKSIKYVKKFHDHIKNGKKIIKLYETI